MVIKKLKKILLLLFLGLSFQIFPVQAEVKDGTTVLAESRTEQVEEKKMTFLEDLHYRIIYKDTKDFFDWVLLGAAVVALLIVMVFQNTHYVIVMKPLEENAFLEQPNHYTIEEVVAEAEKVEETKEIVEVVEKEEENPEILSSDLLEEEREEVPKKKNRNSKKKRA